MISKNMARFTGLLLVILLLNAVSGADTDADVEEEEAEPFVPIVKLFEGEVKGKVLLSYSGRDIYTFLGIPYAQPPVGDLRFTPPRRVKPWHGVRDATREGNICAQLNYPERDYVGDEDCLYINVYTTTLPTAPAVTTEGLHDVVVIIHGGEFSFNSGNSDEFMPDNLLEHDLVMVSFNYRLGVMGFLSTGDESSPGNYGLKDQLEAIAWVDRNIEYFGGNPLSITLLGYQAGAASAHFHLLSMMTPVWFHKIITISGTALSPYALVDLTLAKQRAEKLGKLVGCKGKSAETSKALIKCLRKKYSLDLVMDAPKVMEWGTEYAAPFAPVIEPRVPDVRAFIHEHPLKTMEKLKKGVKGGWEKPWLIGVAMDDALPQALQAMVFPYMMNNLNSNPEKYVPLFMNFEIQDKIKRNDFGQTLWDYYVGNDTLNYGNLIKLSDLMSDFLVNHGVATSIRMHGSVSAAPIFVYRFSFDPRGENSISLGVPQGTEIEYMFPNVIHSSKRQYKDHERPVIERLTQIVANFAKYGNPTPEGSDLLGVGQSWPDAKTEENIHFVQIDKGLKIGTDFYSERMKFWKSLEPQLEETMKHDEL